MTILQITLILFLFHCALSAAIINRIRNKFIPNSPVTHGSRLLSFDGSINSMNP